MTIFTIILKCNVENEGKIVKTVWRDAILFKHDYITEITSQYLFWLFHLFSFVSYRNMVIEIKFLIFKLLKFSSFQFDVFGSKIPKNINGKEEF